jgi:hypothetical protein
LREAHLAAAFPVDAEPLLHQLTEHRPKAVGLLEALHRHLLSLDDRVQAFTKLLAQVAAAAASPRCIVNGPQHLVGQVEARTGKRLAVLGNPSNVPPELRFVIEWLDLKP